MGFTSINSRPYLKPGPDITGGTPGFAMQSSGFGKLVHRPTNTFGSTLSLMGDVSSPNPSILFTAGFGGPKIGLGPADGATAPDTELFRSGAERWATNDSFKIAAPSSQGGTIIGLEIAPPDGGPMLIGSVGGGGARRMRILGSPAGGTNGTRGDSILSDGANSGAHDSFVSLEFRSTDANSFAGRGSFHQMYAALEVDPYPFGDAYCEGLNQFCAIDNNRKGAFISCGEWYVHNIGATSPARIATLRLMLNDDTPMTQYNTANLGAGSRFIETGAMALEIWGSGTTQAGTGIQITQINGGFKRAISVTDPVSGNRKASGIDGRGGVWTTAKAGVPVDGDYNDARDGMIAVNTSTHQLYFRSGGAWRAAN